MIVWFLGFWNWFIGAICKSLEIQAREVLEWYKQNLVSCSGRLEYYRNEISNERKNSTGNWNKGILTKTLYSIHDDVLKIQMMLSSKVMN